MQAAGCVEWRCVARVVQIYVSFWGTSIFILYKHSQANKFYNENKKISVGRYTLNYTFDEGYAKDWSTRITYELDEKIDEYNAVGDTIFVSPEGDSYIGVNAFQEELNNNQ